MKLIALPDWKQNALGHLTLGKDYDILMSLGNGYVVRSDINPEGTVLLLKERFEHPPEPPQ